MWKKVFTNFSSSFPTEVLLAAFYQKLSQSIVVKFSLRYAVGRRLLPHSLSQIIVYPSNVKSCLNEKQFFPYSASCSACFSSHIIPFEHCHFPEPHQQYVIILCNFAETCSLPSSTFPFLHKNISDGLSYFLNLPRTKERINRGI